MAECTKCKNCVIDDLWAVPKCSMKNHVCYRGLEDSSLLFYNGYIFSNGALVNCPDYSVGNPQFKSVKDDEDE